MDSSSLKAHIQTKQLRPFYIFTGPEVKMMDIYLEQMAKVSGRTVKRLESIQKLVGLSKSPSFLKISNIYVLRDCKEFTTDEKIQKFITQNNTFSNDIIVLVYTTIDKRQKFSKTFADDIIEFSPMRTDVLVKYIQKDCDLTNINAERLVDICDSDYSRILLEIDKINHYAEATNVSPNRALSDLLASGVIYNPPYDAIFDFVDAVLCAEHTKAHRLLDVCYSSGEATMVILSNLYTNTKAVLQVQAFSGENKITEATGLTPFQVKLASGRKNRYHNSSLIYFMQLIREVESGIKTGVVPEPIAVEYLLAEFWG